MHQHAPIHWKENVKRYLKITERNKKKKNHDQEDTDSVHTHARMGGAGGRGAGRGKRRIHGASNHLWIPCNL